MDSELITKMKEYFKKLEDELKILKNERKALVNKINAGESLTRAENKRNLELSELINEVNGKLTKFKELEFIVKLENNFKTLTKKITDEEREKIEKEIVKEVKSFNKSLNDELINITGLDKKDTKSIDKTINEVKSDIESLKSTIEIINQRGSSTKELESELEEKELLLKELENYSSLYINEDELKKNFIILRDIKKTTEEKNSFIKDKYDHKLETLVNTIVEEIKDDLDLEENKEGTMMKENTKRELNNTTEKHNKTWKTVAKIGGAVVLIAAIVYTSRNIDKWIENTKESKDTRGLDSSISQTLETPTPTKAAETILIVEKNPNIDKLVDKGYDEYTATIMCNNYDESLIKEILNMPYMEVLKKYANVKDINLSYLNEYEMYREMFNITASKTVDYVNRSYKLLATNFYEDAEVDDIIKVVMAIDNKDLFRTENATYAQSINTGFNQITMNYLFGTTTEEDVNKLEAIKYFAKEDSDLGRFLTTFSTLAQNIVNNPEDSNAKDEMTNYVRIFATSLNGFTNEPSSLTNNNELNENAQVNDYFDWYMAYNSFVGPLADVLTFPRELQNVDLFYAEEIYHDTVLINEDETLEDLKTKRIETLKKFGYNDEAINIIVNKLYKIYDARELMLTALNDPEMTQICGQSRTLGGE